MDFKDYYTLMGVTREASQDEIKRAYRRLARKYHPDVSKESDADTRFKEVGEAYEVLKDPEKRAAYDQLGANWKEGQDFQPPPEWGSGFEYNGSGASSHSDFFESLFGQQFGSRRSRGTHGTIHSHGEDHHAKVLIDVEDAYHETKQNITLQSTDLDDTGQIITNQRILSVRIPKGVKQGQRIRLSGQGSPGTGEGRAGDLYLEIQFRPHKMYRIEGNNVYLDLPVTPWEAALGASVNVPTPTGVVELKIPRATAQGSKLRLKQRGIPSKPPGDLFVLLQLTIPPANSDVAKRLYEKMKQSLDYNPRSKMGV